MCDHVEDYKYSSLQGLLGETWLDVPVSEDDNWKDFLSRQNTLEWLNKKPSAEHWNQVAVALKKTSFKLPREKGKSSCLEEQVL
ncbi:hypothetical protein AZI85_04610 [Bdellovibrio bacteriovorus]|uniref:Uncharacterized protein n=1 Tax=Bdellovibrio bacteriovorus TaxID=959 RepID=A0A150WI95_BDEBC|nr:hypothetical protein AZI85_04610 [Bdellovibrio bacteriovorus]